MAKIYLLVIVAVVFTAISSYAKDTLTIDKINEVLLTAKVVDDLENLDEGIKRSDFARMVVKASPYKDNADDYVKAATEHLYMVRNVYGDFREDAETSYDDLIRASITLLGYEDKDFAGNKVKGRAAKFVELHLNDKIEKNVLMPITKQDIMIGLYNTLKTEKKNSSKKLYMEVFDDMSEDDDGELNASGMLNKKVKGPYIIKRNENIDIPFEIDKTTWYINGKKHEVKDIKDDIENYGYAICYYDEHTDIVYAYTERNDIDDTVTCKTGYIYDIVYRTPDFTTPKYVDMDIYRYKLASDEMKFAFSHAGHLKKDDHVIIVYNKINDIFNVKDSLESQKDLKEEGRYISGSIITAFKIND